MPAVDDPLVVSGLAVTSRQAEEHDPKLVYAKPLTGLTLPFTPSLTRVFQSSDELRVFLEVRRRNAAVEVNGGASLVGRSRRGARVGGVAAGVARVVGRRASAAGQSGDRTVSASRDGLGRRAPRLAQRRRARRTEVFRRSDFITDARQSRPAISASFAGTGLALFRSQGFRRGVAAHEHNKRGRSALVAGARRPRGVYGASLCAVSDRG